MTTTQAATDLGLLRTDSTGNMCAFTGATCTGSDGATTCGAHNADSGTCTSTDGGTTPRNGADGNLCVFAAATCLDQDGGTLCNAHNADSFTCTGKPSGPKYSTPYAGCMYKKDSVSGTPTSIDDYQVDEVGLRNMLLHLKKQIHPVNHISNIYCCHPINF